MEADALSSPYSFEPIGEREIILLESSTPGFLNSLSAKMSMATQQISSFTQTFILEFNTFHPFELPELSV
jgi:hypothetical protein